MKLKALQIALLLPTMLHAQVNGARYDSNVFTAAGNVPAGAQAPMYTLPYSVISICQSPAIPATGAPCTNTAPIFSDQALTVLIPQPITSDSQGRYGFWIAPGTYTYSVVSPSGEFLGTSPITFGVGAAVPVGAVASIQYNCGGAFCGASGVSGNAVLFGASGPQDAGSAPVLNSSPLAYSGSKTGLYADAGAGDRHFFDFRNLGDWDASASALASGGVFIGNQNLTTTATYDLIPYLATYDTATPKIGTAALNGGWAYGSPSISSPGSSTIEAWCKMPASVALPFMKICVGAVNYAWVGIATTGDAYASYGGGTGTQFITTSVTINDGSWHHLALVLSPSAGATFYVDGVSAGTNAVTPATALVTYTTSTQYVIGTYNNFNTAYQWTIGGGEIDEPAIFNGQEYTGTFTPETTAYTSSTPNIITAWSLDSTGASVFPLFDTASPKFGTGDLLYGTAFAQPSIPDPSNVTVEGWCKLPAVPATTEVCFGSLDFMWVGLTPNGFAQAQYFNTVFSTTLTGSTNIANGAWHHLALVLSSISGATLYVDGTSAATSTITPMPIYNSIFSLGAYNTTNAWTGQIDEVAIFKGQKYTTAFTPPTAAYSSTTPNLLALWHFDGTGASSWSGNIGNGNGYAARGFGPTTNAKLDYSFQALMLWDTTQTDECIGGTLGGSSGTILTGASNQYYVCFAPAGFVSQLGTTTTTLVPGPSLVKGDWYLVDFYGVNGNAWTSISPALTGGITSSTSITTSTTSKTQALLFLLGAIPHTVNGLNNIQIQSYNSKDQIKALRYVAGSDAAGTFDIPNFPHSINFPTFAYFQVASGTGTGLVNTYAIVPKNYLPGEQRPWVIYNHGSLQTGVAIFSGSQNTVVDALIQNGYIVIASDYNSTTCWGNAACVQDIANEQAQYKAVLNLSSDPYVIMESMGGMVTLNSIYYGALKPKAVVGWYPVYSLGGIYTGTGGSGSFNSAIQVAYNFTSPTQYATATAGYDPALDPIGVFSSIPIDIWCSPSDVTVFCVDNGELLAQRINAAGGSATYNVSSGLHGDASNFNPIAVVNFFNSH